jgi:hypothetical protein
MPETLINGYHLLQLCGKEYSEGVSFAVHENDLGDGYDDSLLFGAETGTRKFSISFPTLANYTDSRTYEIDGVMHTAAEYLWELFSRQKRDNEPLVIQSRISNQYYLVKFIDKEFTLNKAYVALLSGQAVFRQIRRAGVSVFDFNATAPWAWLKSEWYDEDFDDGESLDSTSMFDYTENGHLFGVNGAILKKDQQNGKSVVRLDGVDDYLTSPNGVTIYQALMIIRINEATWSNNGGVLTAAVNGAPTNDALLIGNGSGAKFFDLNLDNRYEKNRISYAEDDQQSPMNTFGLVYVDSPLGGVFEAVQIGKDRDFAGRFAKLDVGEVVLWDERKPRSVILEAAEALNSRWAIWS